MPESDKRKKDVYTPPPTKRQAVKLDSARWLAPVMVVCFVIGLAWIVAFYLAGPSIPFMNAITVAMGTLGNLVNVAIGFAFIIVGFVLATRWR